MEKVLDGAKGRTSLKDFKGKVLDGPRGKASLEERLLHFKVLVFWAKCLDVPRIPWRNCWMDLRL